MLKIFKRSFLNPLSEFLNDSRSIGLMLLVCTFISLIFSNSPIQKLYAGLWNVEIFHSNVVHLPHSLLHWINDGLMSIFFLLVGMEIKRELVSGELSNRKQAILPAGAALGGMLVPAGIYYLLNKQSGFVSGWGIPTATDIAFSLGIASLLGNRFSLGLKVFLTALAIIDDLGAIIVIAFFYGGNIQWNYLLGAAMVVAAILFITKTSNKFGIIQWFLGILLWYFTYNSGIHPTISGVVFAFLVPINCLENFENKLHHQVYFIIMPLFALANTAISLNGFAFNSVFESPMPLGIMLGLFFGKPLGICISSWILVKLNLGSLPVKTNWKQLFGAGLLAGIGFTMSVFIATLAFQQSNDINMAKIAILISSFGAMIAGYSWLKWIK